MKYTMKWSRKSRAWVVYFPDGEPMAESKEKESARVIADALNWCQETPVFWTQKRIPSK